MNVNGQPCFCGMCVPDFDLLAVDPEIPLTTVAKPEQQKEHQANRAVKPVVVVKVSVPATN